MVNYIKEKNNIALVGFMATGKTTTGKELANSLGMKLIDIDKFIEEKMDMNIAEIFSKYGQAHFRKIEKEAIEEITKLQDTIISCGGGVCLDPQNIVNIKEKCTVVLLEANPDIILDRTKSDKNRPLLKSTSKEIKELMEARRDSYHKSADIVIDTSGKSVSSVRDEIIKKINS
ncbi:MAG: shikimate kinase [Tissierella sp.]|uniref:shikimate kinase n=1 Tax=Tissierella sp. TaxID=41274 RepID=UPI003F9A5768